jgi:hypothetical protein
MLRGALPPGFRRRVLRLAPGRRLRYRADAWQDAIVAVDRGEIQLECAGQPPRRFQRGDLLSLAGIGLRAIYNSGPGTAVLIAVRKRANATRRTS